MAEKLIYLPIEEAQAVKWRRGATVRTRLVGHPLEELDKTLGRHELRGGSARRGFPWQG